MRTVFVSLVALSLFACSATDSSMAPASGRVAQSESTSDTPAPGNPASVLALGRTYWFVFDESPKVLGLMTTKCGKDGADKVPACLDEIRHEAAREAIRFSGSDTAHLTWTSFGLDASGKEELFLEVPFAVTGIDGAFVSVKSTGAPRGPQAAGLKSPGKDAIAFEVIDESTIAMTDPEKGRLMFRAR